MNRIIRIKRKAAKGFNNAYLLDKMVAKEISYHVKAENLLNRVLHSTEKGIAESDENGENIIISLTTYGKRIYDVHLVIESLFNQTRKPNKIILWLAENEFNESNIPLILKRQQARGLEIAYCKDIKSYKKLIPALKKYPEQIIITIDDDIIYPFDIIENLYREYVKNPQCVHYYRGHKMVFDKNERLAPYKNWKMDDQCSEISFTTFPTGCGGILYPPHCFYEDILREDLFMKLAPTADDIWFKAMTLLKDIPCKKVFFSNECIEIDKNHDIALYFENVEKNMNDVQIKQVFDYYNLWKKIINNKK
jgi:hypothetical protein